MENKNEPAYPVQPTFNSDGQICNERYKYEGLTKIERTCITLGVADTGDPELDKIILSAERKRIAAMAMQGILANALRDPFINPAAIAEAALSTTDELLKQLSNE